MCLHLYVCVLGVGVGGSWRCLCVRVGVMPTRVRVVVAHGDKDGGKTPKLTHRHTQHQGEHGLAVEHWVRKSVLSHAVSITGRRDKTQNYRRTTACSLPGAPEPAQKPQTHSEVLVFCFSFISCQISAVPVVNVHIKHDQSF